MPTRSSHSSRPSGCSGPRRLHSQSHRSSWSRSARFRSSGSLDGTAAPSASRDCWRSPTSPIRGSPRVRPRRSIPSRSQSRSSSTASGSSTTTGSFRSPCLRRSRCRLVSSWESPWQDSESGTRWPEDGGASEWRSLGSGSRGASSRSSSSCLQRRAGTAASTASMTTLVDRRRESCGHSSRIRLTVLGALVEGHDVVYLLWLGLPLLFLFVLSPALAAVALPQLLANGLSDFRSMTDPRYHSVAAVIPFLVAATVLAIAKLPASRRDLAAASVLVCSATVALVVAPWARAVGATPLGGRENVAPARIAALEHAVTLVPPEAAVTTSNIARSTPLGAEISLLGPAGRARGMGRDRSRGSVGRLARVSRFSRTSPSSFGRWRNASTQARRGGWSSSDEGVLVFRRTS